MLRRIFRMLWACWSVATAKQGFTEWHILLLTESVLFFHSTTQTVWFRFLRVDEYSSVVDVYIAVAGVGLFILSGFAKVLLLISGMYLREFIYLKSYALVNQIVTFPTGAVLAFQALRLYFIQTPNYTFVPLAATFAYPFTLVPLWFIYFDLERRLRGFPDTLVVTDSEADAVTIKPDGYSTDLMGMDETSDGIVFCRGDVENIKENFILSWNITFGSKIGEGQFGSVYKCALHKGGIRTPVAAKTYKQGIGNDSQSVSEELRVLLHAKGHINVVEFVGVGWARPGGYFLTLEYCSRGNLKTYLRHLKEDGAQYVSLDVEEKDNHPSGYENVPDSYSPKHYNSLLCGFATGICNGMVHLASKGIIHGDLAIRNILLTESLTPKVTDFGLSKKLPHYKTYIRIMDQEVLPWRWMSPEALKEFRFSEKSDVWAYGVTLWEIFSIGDIPFKGISWSPAVVEDVEDINTILQRPVVCNDEWFDVMGKCWNLDIEERISFQGLLEIMGTQISEKN